MKEKKLYFVAIVPTEPIYTDALNFKQYFANKFNAKAALNSPPHITLHMPFKWREDKENLILQAIKSSCSDFNTFRLQLRNFAAFPPRVIYMDVVNNGTLRSLNSNIHLHFKQQLNIFNADYKDFGFHPHLTLAFRDLKKAVFPEAWQEFSIKRYDRDFEVNSIVLLKHNGKSWDQYAKIPLSHKS